MDDYVESKHSFTNWNVLVTYIANKTLQTQLILIWFSLKRYQWHIEIHVVCDWFYVNFSPIFDHIQWYYDSNYTYISDLLFVKPNIILL